MSEEIKGLEFVSNVIELKPDKKYLLVFKGLPLEAVEYILGYFRANGLDSLGLALSEGDDLKVIEVPE